MVGRNMLEAVPRLTRPRRWAAGTLTALALALALVGAYRPRAPDAVPALGPDPVTVVPGVHLLGGLSPAAAYVVETSEGLVLIDAGLDHEARHLKAQMAALGLDWRSVRAVLLTHAHADHSGGAEYLRAATGAAVYAGQGDVAVLRAAGPPEALFSIFGMPENVTPTPTTVDVELSGEQEVAVGDVRFHALVT